MEWMQVWTIVGILGGLIGVLITIMIWQFSSLHGDMGNIRNDINKLTNRLDGHATRIDQLYHGFGQRIDQLYTMFVEMQREIRDLYKERNK